MIEPKFKKGDRVYVKRPDWSVGMFGTIQSIDIFINVLIDGSWKEGEPGGFFPVINSFKPEHVRLSKLGKALQ